MDTIKQLTSMNFRELANQIVSLAMVVCSALVIWKFLILYTGCESPIVVVLSGSMEPAFYRGDLLFLSQNKGVPYRVGDIVVFKIMDREIPIVHRVIRLHDEGDHNVDILTKGDNNEMDDRGLYAKRQLWLNDKDFIGRAQGMLPYIGMVTIIMNDYPALKFILIGVLALLVITNRE